MAHDLVCSRCGELHQFTVGEMERIIYTLQGMEVDATINPRAESHAVVEEWCLREVLKGSRDSELYGEYVDATHEWRLNLQHERVAAAALGATHG